MSELQQRQIYPQFGEQYQRYQEIRRAQRISPNTMHVDEKASKRFWKFLTEGGFTGNEIDVRREQALAYVEHITSRDDLKANTKLILLSMIRCFYREALRQEWILTDPWARIPLPRQERIIPFTLTVDQMKALLVLPRLDTVEGIRDRALMELIYSCALRKFEVMGLRTGDFSEDYRRLHITGKGRKEAVLPVGKMAAHFIKFFIEQLRPRLKNDGGDLVFYSLKRGKPLDARYLERIVQHYGEQLGLKEKLKPHTFRYSVASHLSEQGVDLRLIQVYLRHDSIDTTSRYIRMDFRRLQEVHHNTHPREDI